MKKAILWDLDDTLYDYDIAHQAALTVVYNLIKGKYNISKTKFRKLYELSRHEIHIELEGTASSHNRILYFQRLFEHIRKTENKPKPISAEFILSLYDTYWDTYFDNMTLFPNVEETLKKLKTAKIKMLIVTDLTTSIQLRKLKILKISHYFDNLVTSEETGSDKPNSIMFLKALHKLNILPSAALMVGDNSHTDIEGANAVGIDTVLFVKPGKKPLNKQEEGYRKALHVICDISQVLNLIN